MVCFKEIPLRLPGGTGEKQYNPLLGQSTTGTSQIRSTVLPLWILGLEESVQ